MTSVDLGAYGIPREASPRCRAHMQWAVEASKPGTSRGGVSRIPGPPQPDNRGLTPLRLCLFCSPSTL